MNETRRTGQRAQRERQGPRGWGQTGRVPQATLLRHYFTQLVGVDSDQNCCLAPYDPPHRPDHVSRKTLNLSPWRHSTSDGYLFDRHETFRLPNQLPPVYTQATAFRGRVGVPYQVKC